MPSQMGEGVVFPVVAEVVTTQKGKPGWQCEAAGLVQSTGLGRVLEFTVGQEGADQKQLQGTQQRGEGAVEHNILNRAAR